MSAGRPAALKIVYTDVDGTLVGLRGSFFATGDGEPTLEPARALVALHTAGVRLVLVSGRKRSELQQDSMLLGADGFIAELGGLVGWGHGRTLTVSSLPGVGAPAPDSLVTALCASFDIALYEPWSTGHEVDVLLRGMVSVPVVDEWLAARGYPHLRLRDNGVASHPASASHPRHVYHLLPDGISKGAAVAWDLARRGLTPADALAVGDSVSDLEMAPSVGSFALVANGHAPAILPANVSVTAGSFGLGWAEAVLRALST